MTRCRYAKAHDRLLRCGVCSRSITGEVKRKPSGKQYIYYHCSNRACPEKRRVIAQDKLFDQIRLAFEPFAHFTPKVTQAVLEKIKPQLGDMDLYAQSHLGKLAQERIEIKERLKKIESLYQKGALKEEEYAELKQLKGAALEQKELEIEQNMQSGEQFWV